MAVKQYQVVWTKRSQQHINQAYEYIGKDSPQNALKVVRAIAAAVEKARSNPEIYSPDKYKKDNDGSYRAFETHHYRVSYRFTKNIIRVLRIRHTSMEPKPY